MKKEDFVSVLTSSLLFTQVLCGFLVIVLGEYFKKLLQRVLGDMERFEIFTIILFIQLSGVYLITLYLCGVILIKITKCSRYSSHLVSLLRLWLLVSVQAGTGSLIVALICNKTLFHLETTLELTFSNSIQSYYTDSNWKLIWDELQYNVQCCGVYGYTDWLNESKSIPGMEIVIASGKHQHFVPYSCCKRDTLCNEENMGDFNIYTINHNGCYDEIIDKTNSIIHQIVVLHVVVFIVEVLLLIVFRVFINLRRSCIETGCDEMADSCELLPLSYKRRTRVPADYDGDDDEDY